MCEAWQFQRRTLSLASSSTATQGVGDEFFMLPLTQDHYLHKNVLKHLFLHKTCLSLWSTLDVTSAPWLIEPLRLARGCWRMPGDAVVPFRKHQRGLPQGVATSVVLSELCVSIFLWRLHGSVSVKAVCYVDDLTVIAATKDDMVSGSIHHVM